MSTIEIEQPGITCCPECGSIDFETVDGGPDTIQDNTISEVIACSNCPAVWRWTYTLIKIEKLPHDESIKYRRDQADAA